MATTIIMTELEKYIPFLNKVASKFPEKHREDLVNEGYIAMYEASKRFDDTKEVGLETFAYKRVYGAMVDYLNNINNTVSLDNTAYTDEEGEEITHKDLLESEEDFLEDFENRDYYEKNLDKSTQIERFIKQRFFEEDMTPKEIADLYGEMTGIKSPQTIKKIISR